MRRIKLKELKKNIMYNLEMRINRLKNQFLYSNIQNFELKIKF